MISMKQFLFPTLFLGSTLFGLLSADKMFYNFKDTDELSELAVKFDTDKSPKFHNYTKIYESFFREHRLKPLKFLEIGIFKGSSVRMWEEYFLNAELHFIDISLEKLLHMPQRSSFHLVDQSNKKELNSLIEKIGGDFDIIIDDGGHHMHEQIASFETLFPHLKSGGLYIIEDLHTSYWLSYRGNKHGVGNRNTVGFLKNLINDVNYVGYKLESPNQEASGVDSLDLNIYQKEILSMTFFGSLCFIVKR